MRIDAAVELFNKMLNFKNYLNWIANNTKKLLTL